MSTIASRGFQDTSRRAYIAAATFNNDFYSYTLLTLPNRTFDGVLGPVLGALTMLDAGVVHITQ